MSQDELLDQVDESGKVIGQATKAEFHKNPEMIHPVVHCWVFNLKGEILWQQRSLNKDLYPGAWDISCGGHVQSKETPGQGLQRELNEELGVENYSPIFVGKYIWRGENQSELVYLYYVVIDKPVEEFTIQKSEVEKVEWISPDKALELAKSGERQSTDWIFEQLPKIMKVFNSPGKVLH